MNNLIKTLPITLLMALATPLFAQSTSDSEPAPDAMQLSMGEEGEPGEIKVGDIYVDSAYDDWELRCIKVAEGDDPCQLYQLLKDANGNPVAEINIFPLRGEGQPAAGATVITPLETLLTQQLSISVDGGSAKKYPFSWCSQVGCFSRMGFAEGDVELFRKGNKAALTIVPVADPSQKVNLMVSLKGFTAGFKAADAKLDPH